MSNNRCNRCENNFGCGNGNFNGNGNGNFGNVEIEALGGAGNCNDTREFNCRNDRRVVRHVRIVKHRHDVVHEYDVIHEHDYHYYDVVRTREIDRHHNHRDYRDDGYCDGQCERGCECDGECNCE